MALVFVHRGCAVDRSVHLSYFSLMKLIQLNGEDGGGQMLRTALSLAVITGQPFRMTNIRGQRRKPGLMRQHLTCVKAAAEISGGITDGADIGSTELVFRADKVKAGEYHFAIGTAGSTTLLLQTLLPALWLAKDKSTLRLSGGTHNPLAPCFDFIECVFLPLMKTLGAEASLDLIETGFAPSGGGTLECTITPPSKGFDEIQVHDRGDLIEERIKVISRNIASSITERIYSSLQKEWPCSTLTIEERDEGPDQGLICLAEAEFESGIHMESGCAERGVSAEKLGLRLGRHMQNHLGTQAPIGRHLADQLLLPMALASKGSFLTTAPDNHVPTNISVIEQFLPVKFQITDKKKGNFQINCQ